VAFLVEVVGVTDLRRPQTWPVLGHVVTVYAYLIDSVMMAFVRRPASAVMDEVPDDAPRIVQASVRALVVVALLPAAVIVLMVLFGLIPAAMFDVVPGAETFVEPVYALLLTVITFLSLAADTPVTQSHTQSTTTFEHEDNERISEAQQQYVEGELTEDELEAELETGLERGDK